jgi:hypothetical protein
MPQISAFYGIVIAMFFNDHVPPHFHAYYGGDEASIAIETSEIVDGKLPRRALRLVREWTKAHREELLLNWELAHKPAPLNQIAPLS